MKSIKLVIFDLDGTLVDAYDAIAESFNFTMRRLGLPRQRFNTIKKAVGWGDKNLLLPFAGKSKIDKALKIYRAHHVLSLRKKAWLIPGTKKILSYLYKKGYKLAVASNRPTSFSLIMLNSLKIKKYFKFILCADKLKNAKPHPEILVKIMRRLKADKKNTIYIGDMAIDAQAGKAAGVSTVAVYSGSSSKNEIKKEKPNYICKNIVCLRNIL